MPHALDTGDRKLLIGAGVLLAILLVATAYLSPASSPAARSAYPSTYSADWGGAKAAYLLLQNLHYRVERWEQSPAEHTGDPSNEIWIFAGPTQAATEEEKSAILDFLQRGGRVVASGSGASRVLPQAHSFGRNYFAQEAMRFPAVLPSPIMRGAPEVSMFPPDNWQPTSSAQLVVYGNEETAAVITYRVGKGEVIWWGDPFPLTNGGIRDSGNLPLFLNSVGPPEGVRVLWDEYFHGTHGSLWSYFLRTPLVWGAVQFLMVFLAIVATYSRRQGPINAPAKVSRLSPLEFVETLGDLYCSAHAGATAVRIACQRLRFRLARELGLPPNAADADLAHSASTAFAWNEQEISATLSRAERAMSSAKVSDAETLEIVQQMFDYASRLELRRVQTDERPSA
jgi:Domain of unknown function (DUF4350)